MGDLDGEEKQNHKYYMCQLALMGIKGLGSGQQKLVAKRNSLKNWLLKEILSKIGY